MAKLIAVSISESFSGSNALFSSVGCSWQPVSPIKIASRDRTRVCLRNGKTVRVNREQTSFSWGRRNEDEGEMYSPGDVDSASPLTPLPQERGTNNVAFAVSLRIAINTGLVFVVPLRASAPLQ
jgi:hypothetical protein